MSDQPQITHDVGDSCEGGHQTQTVEEARETLLVRFDLLRWGDIDAREMHAALAALEQAVRREHTTSFDEDGGEGWWTAKCSCGWEKRRWWHHKDAEAAGVEHRHDEYAVHTLLARVRKLEARVETQRAAMEAERQAARTLLAGHDRLVEAAQAVVQLVAFVPQVQGSSQLAALRAALDGVSDG